MNRGKFEKQAVPSSQVWSTPLLHSLMLESENYNFEFCLLKSKT